MSHFVLHVNDSDRLTNHAMRMCIKGADKCRLITILQAHCVWLQPHLQLAYISLLPHPQTVKGTVTIPHAAHESAKRKCGILAIVYARFVQVTHVHLWHKHTCEMNFSKPQWTKQHDPIKLKSVKTKLAEQHYHNVAWFWKKHYWGRLTRKGQTILKRLMSTQCDPPWPLKPGHFYLNYMPDAFCPALALWSIK